jgi:hypothetical protein
MNIAKLIDGQLVVADYREMFKETSFPVGGPDNNFFTENNCYKVSMFKQHDRATQMLVGCGAYVEDGVVYTVEVQTRPEPIIQAITIETLADSISGGVS